MASNAKARDVRQRCLADSNWPPLFQVIAPVKGRGGEIEQCPMYFLLPHEVLCHMWTQSDHTLLLSREGLDKVSNEVLDGLCKELQTEKVIPLSLWMDSVPYSWERDESVQCWTWGLPGISALPWKSLRFPFTCLPKASCVPETLDFVLKVWSWAMSCLSQGVWPQHFSLHAGEAIPLVEKMRVKMAGEPMPFKGVMLQVKVDWEALANVLHFPRWDNASGICHKCRILKSELLLVELDAPWRQEQGRVPPDQLLQEVPPLFSTVHPIGLVALC